MSINHVHWDLAAGGPRRFHILPICHVKEVQNNLVTVLCQGNPSHGSVLAWTFGAELSQNSTISF